MTLLANRLYLRGQLIAVFKRMRSSHARVRLTYESVRKPEAATPHILRFQELRSSSYRS